MIEYIESESDKEITQFWIDRCLRLEAENNDLLAKIRTARDEEREECAKIVDHFKWWVGRQAKHEIATAIRMRSNAKVSGAGTASAGLPGYAAGGNGERE
jgi:hypothetical protein